ncbi:MAG TPA: hypothetical protein VHA52_08560, partial [Candidatus Babeliaceae bacterium]|nr:hypothetical protein [Candidatus Babeliaceae bacterium]
NKWFSSFKRFGEQSRTTILNDITPRALDAVNQELSNPNALHDFTNTDAFIANARSEGGYYDSRLKQLASYEDLLTRQLSVPLTNSTVNEVRGRVNEIEHYKAGQEALPVRPQDILNVADNEFRQIIQDQQLSPQQIQDRFASSLNEFMTKALPTVSISPTLEITLFELERLKGLQARLSTYGLDRYITAGTDPVAFKNLQDLTQQLRQQVEQLTDKLYKAITQEIEQLQGDESAQLTKLLDLEKIVEVIRQGNSIAENGKIGEVEGQAAQKVVDEMKQKEAPLRYAVTLKNFEMLVSNSQQNGVSQDLVNAVEIHPRTSGNIFDAIKQRFNYEEPGIDFNARQQRLQLQRDEFHKISTLLEPLTAAQAISQEQFDLKLNHQDLNRRIEQIDSFLKKYESQEPMPSSIALDKSLALYLKIPQDQYLALNKEYTRIQDKVRLQVTEPSLTEEQILERVDATIRNTNVILLNNIWDIYRTYPDITLKNSSASSDFFDATYRIKTGESIPKHLKISAEIISASDQAQYSTQEIGDSYETGFKQFLKTAGDTLGRILQSFPDAVKVARFKIGDFLESKGAIGGAAVGFLKVFWDSWNPIKALIAGGTIYAGLNALGKLIKPTEATIKELNARRDELGKRPLGSVTAEFQKLYKEWGLDDSMVAVISDPKDMGWMGRTVQAGLKYAEKVWGRVKAAAEQLAGISNNNQRLLNQATTNFDTAKKLLYQALGLRPGSPADAIYKAIEDKRAKIGKGYLGTTTLDRVINNFVVSGKQLVETHAFIAENFINNIAAINQDIIDSGNLEAQRVTAEIEQGKIVSFTEAFNYFDTIFKNELASVQALG